MRGAWALVTVGIAACGAEAEVVPAGGARDPAFGANGVAETPPGQHVLFDVALTPDGRIVGGGTADLAGRTLPLVVRWTEDGQLDGDFGSGGLITPDLDGGFGVVYHLTVDADDRIVVAGEVSGGMFVGRFMPSGTRDLRFGAGGWIVFGPSEIAQGVRVLDDGTTVLVSSRQGGAPVEAVLRRLDDDGLVVEEHAHEVPAPFWATTIEPDGAAWISVESWDASGSGVMRIEADGTAGSPGPVVRPDSGLEITALTIDAAGRPVASARGRSLYALRFGAGAAPDPAFGAEGLAATPCCASGGGEAFGLGVQPDGAIVIIGWGSRAGPDVQTGVVLTRLTAGGATDLAYGDDGLVEDPVCSVPGRPCATRIEAGVVDAEGRAYAAGYSGDTANRLFLARYLP